MTRAGTVYAALKPQRILTGRTNMTMVMTMVIWKIQ